MAGYAPCHETVPLGAPARRTRALGKMRDMQRSAMPLHFLLTGTPTPLSPFLLPPTVSPFPVLILALCLCGPFPVLSQPFAPSPSSTLPPLIAPNLAPSPQPPQQASTNFYSTTVPFQCPASLALFSARAAQLDFVPQTDKFQALPAGSKTVWPSLNISQQDLGPFSFGWVETAGTGLTRATVNSETCSLVSARTVAGLPFDQGPRQQAFFVATLTRGSIRMVAKLVYLPQQSLHQLCYTAPTTGPFSLHLMVGFTNAWHVGTCVNTSNYAGYAHYQSVLTSWVKVTGRSPPGLPYNATAYRGQLPVCTLRTLAQASLGQGSEGYWDTDTWHPHKCRVPRLQPSEMLQCLSGRRLLLMGDSQMRILFGVLQVFLNSTSRAEFEASMATYPVPFGDFIKSLAIAPGAPGVPPIDATTGQALSVTYPFLNGNTTFYGGIYEGFATRHIYFTTEEPNGSPATVDFNLTYSSYFTVRNPIFFDWKLNGSLSNGVKVSQGGLPFDMVLYANHIHDSGYFNTTAEYLEVLSQSTLNALQNYVSSSSDFVMLGGFSALESHKGVGAVGDNNVRLTWFETETAELLSSSQGALNESAWSSLLRMSPLTLPRSDLSADGTHYSWPVSFAMLDLLFGSLCQGWGPSVSST